MVPGDITPDVISKFIGGQLETTPSFGPLRRGEIGKFEIIEGFFNILQVYFAWSVISRGDVMTFKGWKSETKPEPVRIPLDPKHTLVWEMDMGRILIITQVFGGIPVRNLFMAPGCGMMERPKKKGERR